EIRGDGGSQVEAGGALLVHGLVRLRLRCTEQCVLQLVGLPVRVLLREQCGGTGDVRRRHRRTGGGGVEVVDRVAHDRALRAGGDDADTGRGDLRLQARIAESRPAAGEVGELVLAVHGADGERRGGRSRRTDRLVPALVAGRNDEQRSGLRGDV